MPNRQRIIEIMKELDMNTNNESLVLNVMIIYVQAQRDLLHEQVLERNNDKV